MKKSVIICIFSVFLALLSNVPTYATLITTSTSGNLMFQYLWGEAGPSVMEFGIGTPRTDSVVSERNTIFIIDNRAQPTTITPSTIRNMGYYFSGSQLDFYNISDYNGNLYAFSSNLGVAPTVSDLAVFTDTNNSLGLGGSVVRNVGDNQWILNLDDAWSYAYDDDDNEMVIKVWVDPTAHPPITPEIPVPEPSTLLLIGIGLLGFGIYRRKSNCF